MKALLIAPPEAPGLRPLSQVTPAPLLPLLGAPLICPLLDRLAKGGVTDVVLACPFRGAAYKRTLLDGRPWGLSLAVLELADAHSASLALEAVRACGFHDQTLAVLPANCWTDADWPELEAAHWEAGGRLSGITAQGAQTGAFFVDPGVSLSSEPWRALAADCRWRPVTDWREYWTFAKEALDQPALGVAPRFDHAGRNLHLGPMAALDFSGVDAEGTVWLAAGARVHTGAVLRGPVWIGADSEVGPGVRLEACIVEAGARLHGPLALSQALVVANRAIDFATGEVQVLDEDRPMRRAGSADLAMTEGLAQLATCTARVLQAAR